MNDRVTRCDGDLLDNFRGELLERYRHRLAPQMEQADGAHHVVAGFQDERFVRRYGPGLAKLSDPRC